jgi:hypothetical protein
MGDMIAQQADMHAWHNASKQACAQPASVACMAHL